MSHTLTLHVRGNYAYCHVESAAEGEELWVVGSLDAVRSAGGFGLSASLCLTADRNYREKLSNGQKFVAVAAD